MARSQSNEIELKTPSVDKVRAELARRGVVLEEVSVEEQERRASEREKCRSVCYFVDNYVQTYDPRLPEPYIPFKLFQRQVEFLKWLSERQRTQTRGVVEKSKDVGVTELCVAFLVHRWLFFDGFAGGLGSRKLEYVDNIGDPKSLFEKARRMLRRLPVWMLPSAPAFDWKRDSFECRLLNREKQASLIGEGGLEIGRGGRTSMYVVDEYNYLEHPELADAALRDNTNVLIYVGTPNGMVGIYEKREHWPTFRFHWTDDPRKSYWEVPTPAGGILQSGKGPNAPEGAVYPWYERQKEAHKDQPWIVRQEIDIDYLGSGFPRFDRAFLAELKQRLSEPLLVEGTRHGWSAEVKTWRHADSGKRYLIIADVAEGESNPAGDPDYSSAHVYDVETWEQVCTYRGRPDTHAYAVDLAVLGEMYNFADLAVERTGPGLSTIKTLTEEIGYPSVWSEAASGDRSVPGIRATHKSKVESESELASIICDMREAFSGFIWNDPNTLDELMHFMVKPNGRAEAEASWHDDEVTCCKIASVLLPQLTSRRRELPISPANPKVYYGTGSVRGRR